MEDLIVILVNKQVISYVMLIKNSLGNVKRGRIHVAVVNKVIDIIGIDQENYLVVAKVLVLKIVVKLYSIYFVVKRDIYENIYADVRVQVVHFHYILGEVHYYNLVVVIINNY